MLLDTNIVIALFKGNADVISRMARLGIIDIPYVVLGELLLGAYRSSNTPKHLTEINSFIRQCNIIPADAITADFYAKTKTALLKKGKPIPENDIWIAATALRHRLTLVTMDKHFNEVEGLQTENWVARVGS